jgi:trehalose synthase
MLHRSSGYSRGGNIDARWYVVTGDAAFFRTTKALHHLLHGHPARGGEVPGPADRRHYEAVMAKNADCVADLVGDGDIVVLQDPQTAGLAPRLRASGATLVWRCHVGADTPNTSTTAAWEFLTPYLDAVDAFVFSRQAYVPAPLAARWTRIICPSIDPFSTKNVELEPALVRSVLRRIGVTTDSGDGVTPTFVRHDGTVARVDRTARIVRSGHGVPYNAPLVLQVSRWDPLKDMPGVIRGFATTAEAHRDAHLVLAGPDVSQVTDDPEGQQVLDECVDAWSGLPAPLRDRVHLTSLPMDDLEENGLMVNALQRHATVVVQKSLAEGFGLTVTEALWKGRPVIASAVGGIVDQIEHGHDGLLLHDPTDPDELGRDIQQLLADRRLAEELGRNARARAMRDLLDDRQLEDQLRLYVDLTEQRTFRS